MILQAIEERFGLIGTIVARLLGLAWTLVTFLVVPILVLEDLGVGDALKRSKDLFKKTWGENVIGQFGLGFIGFLLALPGILLIAIGAAAGTAGLVVLGGIGAVLLIASAVIVSALSGIYRTALYHFAANGSVPGEFSGIDFDAAFRRTRQPRWHVRRTRRATSASGSVGAGRRPLRWRGDRDRHAAAAARPGVGRRVDGLGRRRSRRQRQRRVPAGTARRRPRRSVASTSATSWTCSRRARPCTWSTACRARSTGPRSR